MLSITPHHKIYLAVQAIEFRRGIDGLSALCRTQFALDPFSGHCFIFRNKKASAIKVLLYDSQGFVLCQKRLSKGMFRYWPKTSASILILDNTQLQVLLQNGNPGALDTGSPWRLLTD